MYQLNLKKNHIYTRNTLNNEFKKKDPSLSDIRIRWLVFELEKNNQISKIGQQKYIANLSSKKYLPASYNFLCGKIGTYLDKVAPLVKVVLWESTILNEWTNLLLSKNIIFVEVESGLESFIFEKLMDKFGDKYTLLLNPKDEMVSRYMRDNLVIVKTLFSRAPTYRNSRKIKLEKLIVDIIADRYLSGILGTDGIKNIIRGIKSNYIVDIDKTFTYAKRRKKEAILKDFWG